MQPVVKGIHIQRLAADADDIRVLRLALQQFDIGIHGGHVLVVKRGRLGQGPFILLAVLQQVALVFFQQQVVQPALLRLRYIVLAQPGKDRVDLVQVDRHVFGAFPVIRAAVGHDALAHVRIDLVQQHAQPGDQRLQRVLRVGALVLVPQGAQQLLVGHRRAFMQDQVLDQRSAFLGLGSQMVRFLLINIDQEMIHHLNANRLGHGQTLLYSRKKLHQR